MANDTPAGGQGGNSAPGQPRPLDMVNVYGDTINVTYKDGGPKQGNQTGANDPQKPIKEVAADQKTQTKELTDLLESLADRIAKALASQLKSGEGGYAGGGGDGATERRRSQSATRESFKQGQLIETMAGEVIEDLEAALEETSSDFQKVIKGLVSFDNTIAKVVQSGFQGLQDTLVHVRQQLINFAGDLMSGQYAIKYFTEKFEEAQDATSRGMSTFGDMIENIVEGGVSISDTIKSIKADMADGGNAYAMSALNAREYGEALADQRDRLQDMTTNIDAMLSFQDQDQLLQNVYEQLVSMGIDTEITDRKTTQMAAWQFNLFKDIAKATGRSVEELVKMNKKAPISITEAIAEGQYSEEEGKKLIAMYQALKAADPTGKAADDFARHVADPTGGFDGTYNPQQFAAGYQRLYESLKQRALAGDGSAQSLLDAIMQESGQVKKDAKSFGPGIRTSPFLGADTSWVSTLTALEKTSREQAERLKDNDPAALIGNFFEKTYNQFLEWLSKNEWVKGIMAIGSALVGGGLLLFHAHAMFAHTKALTIAAAGGAAGAGGGLWGAVKSAFGTIPKALTSLGLLGLTFNSFLKLFDPQRKKELDGSLRDLTGHVFDSAGALLFGGFIAALSALVAPGAIATSLAVMIGGLMYEAIDMFTEGEASKWMKGFGQFIYDMVYGGLKWAMSMFPETSKDVQDWWNSWFGTEKPVDTVANIKKPDKPVSPEESAQLDKFETRMHDAGNNYSELIKVMEEMRDYVRSLDSKTRHQRGSHDTAT